MHTRSKRYLRRHRARLRAQRRESLKPFQCEDRLARADCRRHEEALAGDGRLLRAHDPGSNRILL